jgi:hypothetical protein
MMSMDACDRITLPGIEFNEDWMVVTTYNLSLSRVKRPAL